MKRPGAGTVLVLVVVVLVLLGLVTSKKAPPSSSATAAPAKVAPPEVVDTTQRDKAIALLREGQQKGWSIFVSEVAPNPYSKRDVVVVVNNNWLLMKPATRLKLVTDIDDLFRTAYPNGILLFWNEKQNRVAHRKPFGDMELDD